MNNTDLINQIAEELEITKALAERVINKEREIITNFLKDNKSQDEKATALFMGWGSFSASYIEEREGRNPQTGDATTIDAHYRINFKPGKGFKDAVNEKTAPKKTKKAASKKAAAKAPAKKGKGKKKK